MWYIATSLILFTMAAIFTLGCRVIEVFHLIDAGAGIWIQVPIEMDFVDLLDKMARKNGNRMPFTMLEILRKRVEHLTNELFFSRWSAIDTIWFVCVSA